MRCTRIIASIVFSTSLLISLCFSSFANDVDTLVCESGVGHFVGANSSLTKWLDYTPVVNNGVYTFSDIPHGMTSGNSELALESFTFLTYSYNTSVTLERGYIYTFNFKVTTNRVSSANAERAEFRFGMCEDGFTNNLPLSSVTYTYSYSSAKVTYNCTAVVNVDSSIDFTGLTSNDAELYYYLQITAPWSNTFTLTASNMTKTKSLGEESYYQASVDAIENLPNSEYDFILNKMPNAEGEIQVIQGDILDILQAYDPGIQQLVQIMRIDQAKPCVYLPQVSIPIVDIDVFNNQVFFVDDYLNSMNPAIMSKLDVVLVFIRLIFCVTFATFTVYKLARIEWWY